MFTLELASLELAARSGCARPSPGPCPSPPSEEVRARLGRVVVRADGDFLAESVLAPGRKYSWTVRARFRVDGSRRRTEWTRMAASWERDGNIGASPVEHLPLKIEPLR